MEKKKEKREANNKWIETSKNVDINDLSFTIHRAQSFRNVYAA